MSLEVQEHREMRVDPIFRFTERGCRTRGKIPNNFLGFNHKGKRRSQKEAKEARRNLFLDRKRDQALALQQKAKQKAERNKKAAEEKAKLEAAVKQHQEEERKAEVERAKLDVAIKKKRFKRLKIAAEAKRAAKKLAGKPSGKQKAQRGQPHKINKANKAGSVVLT